MKASLTKSKKGNMIGMGKQFIIMLLIVTVIGSVTGLVLDTLSTSIRSSGTAAGDGYADPWNVSNNTVVSVQNFSTQLGTVGTIAGVSLLLVVIGAGLLSLFKKKGGF